MNGVDAVVQGVRRQARAKRAHVFRDAFRLAPSTRIIDIGSEDGSAIAAVIDGTPIRPGNVHIADIDENGIRDGARRFGFVPVPIPESGRLPFGDGYFDIVYCSSVIEHVTVPKSEVWSVTSGSQFRARARPRQREFAEEIRRLGKAYFVQTPSRWFPIESHTWLPLLGFLPRSWQIRAIRLSNRYWVKHTSPDWHLLTARELQELFPDAEIRRERFLGMTKSLMAIRR